MAHPPPDAPAGVDADDWASAVEAIRAHCGWHIAPEITETVTVDGPGGGMLFLPTMHLVDLASVTNDGAAVTDPEWSQTGMVRHHCWTCKFRGVTAEMTHGFEEWPGDLMEVTLDMLAETERGVTAMTSGPYQVRFEQSLSTRQRTLLGKYSLPGIA